MPDLKLDLRLTAWVRSMVAFEFPVIFLPPHFLGGISERHSWHMLRPQRVSRIVTLCLHTFPHRRHTPVSKPHW